RRKGPERRAGLHQARQRHLHLHGPGVFPAVAGRRPRRLSAFCEPAQRVALAMSPPSADDWFSESKFSPREFHASCTYAQFLPAHRGCTAGGRIAVRRRVELGPERKEKEEKE